MKCNLTLKGAATGSRATLLAVLISASLSACQGTIDTRHVTASDTADEWSSVVEHINVEVHDRLPDVSLAQALKSIPGASTPFDGIRNAKKSESMQRMVVYLGGNTVPTSASYCVSPVTMKDATDTNPGVLVAAGLCDGTRLVDSSEYHFKPDELGEKNLAKIMRKMKTSLLNGLVAAELQDTTRDVDAKTW